MKKVCYVSLRDFRVGDTLALQASVDIMDSLIGEHIKVTYEKDWKAVSNSWDSNRDIPLDLVVHAGGNEWSGFKNLEQMCSNKNIPVIFLGVGTGSKKFNCTTKKMFHQCRTLMLGRDHIATESAKKLGGDSFMLTCPSLFHYKNTDKGDRFGVVFQSNHCMEKPHCIRSEELYNQLLEFIEKHKEERPMLICHYIDDYLDLHNRFPDMREDLRYSNRLSDYIQWYSQCEVIYSMRLHGAMLAASLNKPTVCLKKGVEKSCAFDHLAIKVVEPMEVSFDDLSDPIEVNKIKQKMAVEFHKQIQTFLDVEK